MPFEDTSNLLLSLPPSTLKRSPSSLVLLTIDFKQFSFHVSLNVFVRKIHKHKIKFKFCKAM